MANEPDPKAAAPAAKPNAGPGVVTADDMKTPDAAPAAGVGGSAEAAAKGQPTPGISTDAPEADAPAIPHADPVPGSVKADQPGKEVSANAHQQDTITIHGYIDHPLLTTDGSFVPAHSPGPVQIPNPRIAMEKGQAANAVNEPEDKDPEDIKAANPAGSPLNPRGTAATPPRASGATATPQSDQPTGKAGDVHAPAPRADAKPVDAKPAK